MNTNFNKKKINLIPNKKILKYLIFLILIFLFISFIYYEFNNKKRIYNITQNLSEKYNYQFNNIEINTLLRVNKSEVMQIINKYFNQSIFLIPLDEISKSLHDLNWVKSVNLSTNFKNSLNIKIFEHDPIGLLFYNNQLFYFSKEAKIIDKLINANNENYIIFHGKNVLKEAYNFLNLLEQSEFKSLLNINEAYYINERRWDIKLHNEILLNLSEKNVEESIKNYITLIKQFNKSELIAINNIDLRNKKKIIISFK